MKTPKRIVIISLDTMGNKDLPFMNSLPNFHKIMCKAAMCTQVVSVYPSITYPAHTSIITGRVPKNHGVINNTLFQPGRISPDWMWKRKYIRGTTLYDEAIRQGWRVASLLWPVTAKSRIQYNLPEIFANRPWQNQIIVSAMNGTLRYELELNRKFGNLRDGIRQPALDNFVHASALHTIDKYRPDMLLIHLTDVDTNRHIYGVRHPKAEEAIRRHDERLGDILEHLEKLGNIEDTTIVLLGDHYQKDTSVAVYLNHLLREKGLLMTKGKRIVQYQVIAKNCDGSCYLYKNPDCMGNQEVGRKLKEILKMIAEEEQYGAARIYSSEEAGKMGADDTCAAMIEAREGYYYLDEFDVMSASVDHVKHGKMKATHGYLPDQSDYRTFFMMMGCGVSEGARIERMHLWDEGATLARLLNLDLGQIDGKVVEAFLE